MTVAGRRLVQAIKEFTGLSGNAKGIWPVVGSTRPDHALTVDQARWGAPRANSRILGGVWARVGPPAADLGCSRRNFLRSWTGAVQKNPSLTHGGRATCAMAGTAFTTARSHPFRDVP